ncbi:protein DOG1-like 3 [Musa acuminata AAA Group]|uniref:protein DOG1-like 3 n=1 Tax=Musa acuminata AAA Group TaxID=214697 RepID=UPI0031E17472
MECRFLACYEEWLQIQGADLNELLQAISSQNGSRARSEMELRELVEKSVRHYEEYYERRRRLLREDGPAFFAPPWCNSFEKAVLWVGGCRPSMFIRLIYSLSSAGLEAHLDNLAGRTFASHGEGLVGLSAPQLVLVNELHRSTLLEENRITSQVATLQENLADRPLLPIVKERQRWRRSDTSRGEIGDDGDAEVVAAMGSYAAAMAGLVEAADRLRLETARTLLSDILTPKQAVELLATGKQLHLSVHEWGHQRDLSHSRGG